MRQWIPPEHHFELWDAIDQYGWKPRKVELENGIYKVETESKVYALKQSNRSREKLLLLHQMCDQLLDEGYVHLLPWEKTLAGNPIAEVNGQLFFATEWVEKKEDDKLESAIPLVRSLAQFHRLAEPIAAKFPMLHQKESDERLNHWRERKEKWESFVQQASVEEYPSSIDRLVKENGETVDKLFTFALRGAEKFLEVENGVFPRITLCHKRIHPSNFVQDEEQFYWIDWDHVQIDTPARDLALFLRRFTEWETPEELLQAYLEENPLSTKEKRLLAIYLAYPERFLKKLTSYYEEPRVTTEGEHWQEIQSEFNNYQSFYPLITELWGQRKEQQKQLSAKVKKASKKPARSKKKRGNKKKGRKK